MSISKSFNKRTGVYYAYETSYEWDEIKQKKIQKRRCIGRYNPKTNEILPNGKVGRPAKSHMTSDKSSDICKSSEKSNNQPQKCLDISAISIELHVLKKKLSTFVTILENIHSLSNDIQSLKIEIDRLSNLIK